MRFSAMGDVVMTVPVVAALARKYPSLRITVLTRERLTPFFCSMPANVEVMGIDLNAYKGILGLERLFRQLRSRRFDAVADLHDVLRTKFLRTRFRISGTPVASIDKGRAQKHALIGHGMTAEALTPVIQRYASVFSKLGIELTPEDCQGDVFVPSAETDALVQNAFGNKPGDSQWIGVAPFAAHEGKIYPLAAMRQVVEQLSGAGCRIFLFGGGAKEMEVLHQWAADIPAAEVAGDKIRGLQAEMHLMARLDAMLAMDSANMHIAALVGTRVVSIWGATHPKAGFAPWRQQQADILQVADLPCRPCSIYGNKPCHLGDRPCMARITPTQVVNTILNTNPQ